MAECRGSKYEALTARLRSLGDLMTDKEFYLA